MPWASPSLWSNRKSPREGFKELNENGAPELSTRYVVRQRFQSIVPPSATRTTTGCESSWAPGKWLATSKNGWLLPESIRMYTLLPAIVPTNCKVREAEALVRAIDDKSMKSWAGAASVDNHSLSIFRKWPLAEILDLLESICVPEPICLHRAHRGLGPCDMNEAWRAYHPEWWSCCPGHFVFQLAPVLNRNRWKGAEAVGGGRGRGKTAFDRSRFGEQRALRFLEFLVMPLVRCLLLQQGNRACSIQVGMTRKWLGNTFCCTFDIIQLGSYNRYSIGCESGNGLAWIT